MQTAPNLPNGTHATPSPALPAKLIDLPRAEEPRPAPIAAAPKKKAPFVFAGLVLLAVAGATTYWLVSRDYESTDDAFVEGHVTNVAARVAGQVANVLVIDNQEVKAGDPLLTLDDRDYAVRRDAANADLQAAEAQLDNARAQLALTEKNAAAGLHQAKGGVEQAASQEGSSSALVAQSEADLDGAKSRLGLARLDFDRTTRMRADGASSAAELDARKAALEQATASVDQAQARLRSAQVGVAGARGNRQTADGRLLAASTVPQQVAAARAQVALAEARAHQAKAALDQAELNLSYTIVRAPQNGVVSRRTVEVGQMVDPSRPLLSVVALDDSWVVANFKEDQIAAMHTGQSVELSVDAYPGRKMTGHVESLAGGTGARFALLPPDNATGNFTKVVQRLPVLIRVDGARTTPLRPGMSAVATVRTHG